MLRAALPAALASLALAAGLGARDGGASATHDPRCPPPPDGEPVKITKITRPQWISNVVITEYFPAPERWFSGKLVKAPGLTGRHRVDWLYSSSGVAMEGDGVGLDGRRYHFAGPYGMGWVAPNGRATRPCPDGSWTRGWPAWLSFGWRNAAGGVTYPRGDGSWSRGPAARFIPPPADLRFGPGPSRPLVYWKSVAVDPRLIPWNSRVFVPAYCDTPAKGWFVAADTGGAIIARHIDVYRTAPRDPDSGVMRRGERIFVIPPESPRVRELPTCG